MRKCLLIFSALFLLFVTDGCRKPDYTHRSPCEDSTLLALYERRAALTSDEYQIFDSLQSICEQHNASLENSGKLWPGILAGIAAVAAVGTLILWLTLRNGREEY